MTPSLSVFTRSGRTFELEMAGWPWSELVLELLFNFRSSCDFWSHPKFQRIFRRDKLERLHLGWGNACESYGRGLLCRSHVTLHSPTSGGSRLIARELPVNAPAWLPQGWVRILASFQRRRMVRMLTWRRFRGFGTASASLLLVLSWMPLRSARLGTSKFGPYIVQR